MKPSFALSASGPLIFTAAITLVMGGCGRYSIDQSPEDDEPMRRLRWENERMKVKRTPAEAARQWFLPEYYFDPKTANQDYVEPGQSGPSLRDYFRGMDPIAVSSEWTRDSGPTLATPVFQLFDLGKEAPDFQIVQPLEKNNEVLGRNTWMMWCAGNESFWDWLASDSLGFIDLLKVIDSRNRATRFAKAGLIDEPEMMQGEAPDQFGLWLDIPSDGATRKWRENYLRRTFDEIRYGSHETQRGLKRYDSRSAYTSSAGYQASASSQNDTYSSSPYSHSYWTGDRKDAPPPPEIYGLSSGVVGLRLFPNPNFDDEARKKWDPKRYFNEKDEDYWNDPDLVRPYRVGMACAFCHASYHPLNPPRDLANPRWENISGNIGAQYLRVRATFGSLLTPDNFVYHILDSQPPGTIDTSLIASDNINNPNAMNSVFNLPQRALLSLRNPKESIDAASATQPSIWRHPEANPRGNADDKMPDYFRTLLKGQDLASEGEESNSNPSRRVPRILLDGSDSIGAWGALARVYLNIGTYYEQWNRLHRVVVGFDPQKSFRIADCEQHSVYWNATQLRVAAMRDYFLKATPPMPLAVATADKRAAQMAREKINEASNDEATKLRAEFTELIDITFSKHVDRSQLAHGREVFARNCIVCHSSIQPETSAVTFYPVQQKNNEAEQQQELERVTQQRQQFNDRYQNLISERLKYRAKDAELNEFWEHDPARWLADNEYITWALEAVEQPLFWQLNYLSTDYRVPINFVNTNAARAMATNAIDQNMWDDFASESYQTMPSVGAIEFFDPYLGPNGEMSKFMPRHKVRNRAPQGGGGVGFYRVPTLVSIWATAPLLHNNSLGRFTNDPSIDGRLSAFDDAIHKLLWPERRLQSSDYNNATADRLKQDHGLIWRTSDESYLTLSGRRVPRLLGANVPQLMSFLERYEWLKEIRPLWLPSVLLLLAALIYLLAGPYHTNWLATNADVRSQRLGQRIGGYLIVIVAVALTLLLYYFNGRPWAREWLNRIHPLWLPGAVFLVVGIVLMSLRNVRSSRRLAWATLIIAVAIFVAYLRHGYPQWFAWLEITDPLVHLSAILLLVGIVLVWPGDPQRTAIFNLGRAALLIAVVLCVAYALIWYSWMESSHWLALLIAFLTALGVGLVWLGDPRKTRLFVSGCAALFLAIVLYLLYALRWFSWRKESNHSLTLLLAVLLLTGILLAWLGANRKTRLLGYAVLLFAGVFCLLLAVSWSTLFENIHPLAVTGAVLLLLAVLLLTLVRMPFIKPLSFAILFLAAASFLFSFMTDYPNELPSYVLNVEYSRGSPSASQSGNYARELPSNSLSAKHFRQLPLSLQSAGPLWPLSVMLGFVALLFLVIHDPRKLSRWLGYTTLLLAIATGFLIYFVNGKLGDLRVGPIPKGTPVNLLANINPDADAKELKQTIRITIGALAEIESKQLKETDKQRLMREKVAPALIKVSKCPDFVMDKGHYFEWFKAMTDEDKEALIELLKTF